MQIIYKLNAPLSTEQFVELLEKSGLAQRRPMESIESIEGMLANSNLVLSAWHDDKLIGIARCITDFHYACYLSDLAVDEYYQQHGIGKQLQRQVKNQLKAPCKLIVIAAPAANDYYPKIGFQKSESCWVLEAEAEIQ
ncbi:MAG: GNAT family N-acetyltransferase [Pseudomonadales bacterium]|nr:GNAT family N-acetyltransferase [Pseudomonadales bacterium]